MSDQQEDARNAISRRIDRLEAGDPLLISDYGVMETFGYSLSEYLAALKARLSELEAKP